MLNDHYHKFNLFLIAAGLTIAIISID